MTFTVERWSRDGNRIESTLARSTHLIVARGAYDAAVTMDPRYRITCRQGARVIAEHTPPEPIKQG